MRIISQTGVRFWDFVCRWADEEGRIAQNYAPQFHFEDEPATPFVICLIREQSELWPGTAMCTFLQEEPPTSEHPLGLANCGIHEHRPSACRAFPTKFAPESDLVIIHDVPKRGGMQTDPIYGLCSRQWEVSDIDPVQAVQDLVVARHEMNFFRKMAELWNRDPGEWQSFPDFLEMVYPQRVRRENPAAATEESVERSAVRAKAA